MIGTLMAALLVVGCGPKAPSEQDGQLEIAVIPKGLAHQFWLTVKAGADKGGEEFNAKIIWQGPKKETEIVEQINIIEDMISRRVDAIVMAACDENALIDVVQLAIDAGITVVTIDSGIKSDIPVSFVATDNIAGAKAAARELARLIGEEGEVGLIPFVKGAATSEMRERGFKAGIKEFPNIELVSTLYSESDAAKGMAVTEDMMTSHGDLKGIFVASEPGAIGCAQAISAAGKKGTIKVVAFDASDKEIADLKNGALQALVVQNPYRMGYLGVKTAVDAINKRPVEKRIDTGVMVVTMENFNDPEVQKLLYPTR
ncbi:MAG: substrate-binding domain-containing protein [Nitrospiraceae bacterium]|nr:substrate-binding domain-containing protein [Nitrospiraceae bacterium]